MERQTFTVQTMDMRGDWVTRHEYSVNSRDPFSGGSTGAWANFHMYRNGERPVRVLLDGKLYYKAN